MLLLGKALRESFQVGNQRYTFLAPQFGPSLSDCFLYPRFAAQWPFRDNFTSVGNTSRENSSRGLTSSKEDYLVNDCQAIGTHEEFQKRCLLILLILRRAS